MFINVAKTILFYSSRVDVLIMLLFGLLSCTYVLLINQSKLIYRYVASKS